MFRATGWHHLGGGSRLAADSSSKVVRRLRCADEHGLAPTASQRSLRIHSQRGLLRVSMTMALPGISFHDWGEGNQMTEIQLR